MQRKKKNRIGIDFLGSDNPKEVFLEALQLADVDAEIVAFVTSELRELLKKEPFSFVEVSEVIGMEENPLLAIRRKKNSSICVGINLLKEKKIDAFISSGNTGALLTASATTLPKMPSISRPALLALFPTRKNPLAVIDVGANVVAKEKHLIEFAFLGIAFQKFFGVKIPRVGLLNIGSEEKKGYEELQKSHQKLKEISQKSGAFEFVGNVESQGAFEGDVHVLVTSGFAGNIFLKTAEATASFIIDEIKGDQKEDIKQRLKWEEHLGGIFCGVDGIVIKCHGLSTPKAIASSIKNGLYLLEKNFIEEIKNYLVSF